MLTEDSVERVDQLVGRWRWRLRDGFRGRNHNHLVLILLSGFVVGKVRKRVWPRIRRPHSPECTLSLCSKAKRARAKDYQCAQANVDLTLSLSEAFRSHSDASGIARPDRRIGATHRAHWESAGLPAEKDTARSVAWRSILPAGEPQQASTCAFWRRLHRTFGTRRGVLVPWGEQGAGRQGPMSASRLLIEHACGPRAPAYGAARPPGNGPGNHRGWRDCSRFEACWDAPCQAPALRPQARA